jgi:type II restriction endonuclease TdeIII
MEAVINKDKAIRSLVKTAVQSYAAGFERRHLQEVNDPDGTINMKVHNVFIAALGSDIQYYTALVRSLDSSLGTMLEKLAISIAELSYKVSRKVEGHLSSDQTSEIARLLEVYKRHEKRPEVSDYAKLSSMGGRGAKRARHESDYYLHDEQDGRHHLIELKIGGDLDNKKARSEKEALLEQYAILCNTLGSADKVSIRFATAYNRFGEGRPWRQERVRQFFADEELLIGRDFWNFVCKSAHGYDIVIDEYKRNADLIVDALQNVKESYLG